MSVTVEPSPPAAAGSPLIAAATPSEAGPLDPSELAGMPAPPVISWPRPVQILWFGQLQWHFVHHYRDKLGEVFSANAYVRGRTAITSHPDHIRSLFKAPPNLVPTLASESPLRPVLGPNSVLTANGPRHLRQRKLLLPPFHGEAIERYQRMIAEAAEREIERWPIGRGFALAPRMQAITLDVIMGGIFGIEGVPRPGTVEHALRLSIRELLRSSTLPGAKLAELMNIGHEEPFGLTKLGLLVPDRCLYAIIAKRRRAEDLEERTDILSLIMRARTEEGDALSDRELRDELMTLVLAGHETTANQLAWAWERLVRWPEAHERLVEVGSLGGRRCRRRGRGDDHRGDARAAGYPDDGAAGGGPVAARRVRDPGRHPGRDQHRAAAPSRGPVSRAASVQAGAMVRRSSPGRTSGSRSEAAPAGASARRSRWPSSAWCSRRWREGSTSRRRPRSPSAPRIGT